MRIWALRARIVRHGSGMTEKPEHRGEWAVGIPEDHPKKKGKTYLKFRGGFETRGVARNFCRNHAWEKPVIRHPDGTLEPYR